MATVGAKEASRGLGTARGGECDSQAKYETHETIASLCALAGCTKAAMEHGGDCRCGKIQARVVCRC